MIQNSDEEEMIEDSDEDKIDTFESCEFLHKLYIIAI